MKPRFLSSIPPAFAAAFMAISALTISAHAQIAGDGVASFDIGNTTGSGDITNNPNGLAITGQSGSWAGIATGAAAATDDGVTLTFNGGTVPVWGGTAGDNRGTGSTNAIRMGSFLGGATDIPWTISGLEPNAVYDMIWYNKRVSPGENRAPNTGVAGFDAGNGVGASAPHDGDKDQNFTNVSADGSGNISGTWFKAGGLDDITAVTGVQIKFVSSGGGDVTPPAILTLSPANGATDIATNSNLIATFNEDVQKGTGNIVIKKFSDGTIFETIPVASVTVSGADLTIDPSSDLADGTEYYVEIDNGSIEDLAGNAFPGITGDATWSFTTLVFDDTPPSIDTLTPANGATDVLVDTTLVATFDENVQKGTGNIVIKESGGTIFETIPVASVSVSGAEVTVTPSSNLANSTGYYVEIDNGAIEDISGNDFVGISGDATWAFTTTAPRETAAVVASFNVGTSTQSAEVSATNNPDGLLITGATGDWDNISASTPSATNSGITLTFGGGGTPVWGNTAGDGTIPMRSNALRLGTFLTSPTDIPWTITGLTPGAFYDMIWYNKRGAPTTPGGETRHPNTGVTGFDAGNGDGASGPLDADRDQNFIAVPADESGAISGTWFLAGGTQDITAVAGVQVGLTANPPIATITSFEGAGATGVINQSAKTIDLEVPFGTDLATLAPTFVLSSGTCDQTSGAAPAPTFAAQNPATYTVTDTSTDPDTVNAYSVTVTIAPETATLVIDLGTSPAGTAIEGGAFIGTGPTNLPIPSLPAGSILQSIAVAVDLEATDNENFTNDLAVLVDPTPGTPGGDFSLGILSPDANVDFGPSETLNWVGGGDENAMADTKTAADWTGNIDLASSGLFLGNGFQRDGWVSPEGGTWSGTITLTYIVGTGGGSDFSDWIAGYSVGGQTGIGDDPDGDGVDSGVENFFGTAPDAFTSGLVAATAAGGTFTFTHPQGTLADDLTASYRWSKDLQSFHAGGFTDGEGARIDFTTQADTPAPGFTTVTATVAAGPVPEKVFVRVEVAD